MNEETISKAISEALAEQFRKQSENHICGLGIDRDKHTEEHVFIQSLMRLFDRIDNMKIGLLGKLITAAFGVLFIFTLVGAGVYLIRFINQGVIK